MQTGCLTFALLIATVLVFTLIAGYFMGRRDMLQTMKDRSWGDVFGGGCFEVSETQRKGCDASYTDDTTVTLKVN